MLPKPYRLPGSRLPALLKSQKVFHSRFFILKINSCQNQHPPIGIIIPVKLSRLAVVRNRHKRLISGALKLYLSQLPPNHELLFLAKPPLLNQPLSLIRTEIFKLLQSCSFLN